MVGGDAMVRGGRRSRYMSLCQVQYGWTTLIYAAIRDRADCVRLLINAGADKDAKDMVRVT
jgi:hypothetical protein